MGSGPFRNYRGIPIGQPSLMHITNVYFAAQAVGGPERMLGA
jgi:hypothetical protein